MKALTFFTQVFQGHIIFPAKENSIISIVKCIAFFRGFEVHLIKYQFYYYILFLILSDTTFV